MPQSLQTLHLDFCTGVVLPTKIRFHCHCKRIYVIVVTHSSQQQKSFLILIKILLSELYVHIIRPCLGRSTKL